MVLDTTIVTLTSESKTTKQNANTIYHMHMVTANTEMQGNCMGHQYYVSSESVDVQ